MRLIVEKSAAKALARMPLATAEAIVLKLERIAVDPYAPHPNVKRLVGPKDGFRLRHGSWRALYRLDRGRGELIVENVKPRGSAYR